MSIMRNSWCEYFLLPKCSVEYTSRIEILPINPKIPRKIKGLPQLPFPNLFAEDISIKIFPLLLFEDIVAHLRKNFAQVMCKNRAKIRKTVGTAVNKILHNFSAHDQVSFISHFTPALYFHAIVCLIPRNMCLFHFVRCEYSVANRSRKY